MLAVVGAGHWGRNHVRNFAALGVLSAVCDASPEALDRVTAAYPGVTAYADLAQVLADAGIKAVVLATPAQLHFAQAQAALAAGRHVLVEKPMALGLAEAEALDRIARERGLVLMVGHLLEYHPAFVRLRGLVAAGELGPIIHIDSHRLILGTFRQEESVLWDLAPHDLSMILRLLGDLPDPVQAIGSSCVRRGVEDSVSANLAFPGGARAQLLLSWLYPFKEQRLVVMGTRKMAVFDDVVKEGKLRVYPTCISWEGDKPVASSGDAEVVAYPEGEPLRAECEHFLRCLESGEQPLTNGASGVQITRVLEACERSMRAGGSPVGLARRPTAARPSRPTSP
jgi:UDP-2-acetamido-3-amino-2,3-dideoxy-glucuronate N-acetyltransferase